MSWPMDQCGWMAWDEDHLAEGFRHCPCEEGTTGSWRLCFEASTHPARRVGRDVSVAAGADVFVHTQVPDESLARGYKEFLQ
ncbi:MAG: hypothetical protein EXS23_01060 [Pedosphaera sp.]|nr:hypothetical protein [Pedosphaera sp.]